MKVQPVKAKLPKSVKRITILKARPESDGGSEVQAVVKKKRKRKRKSKGLMRIMERVARRNAEANSEAADSYLSRHRRSNRKRRDGWVRDLGYNWMRARRKGDKKFKLSKLFS
jgi:hypothetical protein